MFGLALVGLLLLLDGILLRRASGLASSDGVVTGLVSSIVFLSGIVITIGAATRALRGTPWFPASPGVRRITLTLAPFAIVIGLAAGGLAAVRMSGVSGGGSTDSRMERDNDPRVAKLDTVAGTAGLAAALDSLEALARLDPGIEAEAHQIAHHLGRLAMRESGFDAALIRACRPVFHSGCFHGAIEAYFGRGGDIDGEALRHVCVREGAPAVSPEVLECAHGAGHGLLSATGDVFRALAYCEEFDGAPEQWCFSGAFMEGVIQTVPADSGSHAHHANHENGAAAPASTDPHYPCSAVPPHQRHSCYMYKPFEILRSTGFDAEAALRFCEGAPAGSEASCATGTGTQLAGAYASNAARVHALCGVARSDLVAPCVEGAAEYLFDLDWSATSALPFCTAAEGPSREACFRRVGERLTITHGEPSSRAGVCAGAGGPLDVRACRVGARLETLE